MGGFAQCDVIRSMSLHFYGMLVYHCEPAAELSVKFSVSVFSHPFIHLVNL